VRPRHSEKKLKGESQVPLALPTLLAEQQLAVVQAALQHWHSKVSLGLWCADPIMHATKSCPAPLQHPVRSLR
jgi:hypothetical protein